jgi:hypothetical protein
VADAGRAIDTPSWDGHLLLLHQSESDRLARLAEWVRHGLDHREKVLYTDGPDPAYTARCPLTCAVRGSMCAAAAQGRVRAATADGVLSPHGQDVILTAARTTHPNLLTSAGRQPNPGYRHPVTVLGALPADPPDPLEATPPRFTADRTAPAEHDRGRAVRLDYRTAGRLSSPEREIRSSPSGSRAPGFLAGVAKRVGPITHEVSLSIEFGEQVWSAATGPGEA